MRTLGLEIRVGLHAGEYKVGGGDVVGLAFHVGRRVFVALRLDVWVRDRPVPAAVLGGDWL